MQRVEGALGAHEEEVLVRVEAVLELVEEKLQPRAALVHELAGVHREREFRENLLREGRVPEVPPLGAEDAPSDG